MKLVSPIEEVRNDDRSADVYAKLVLMGDRSAVREISCSIQIGVPEIFVGLPVEGIGAGTRAIGQVAARSAAVFRRMLFCTRENSCSASTGTAWMR